MHKSIPLILPVKALLLSCTLLTIAFLAGAQPLTGVWHGKIKKNGLGGGSEQMELKLVRDGDSLFGVAYRYHDPSHFERLPIRGQVDPWTGTVTFWEDGGARNAMVFETDYNCPGEGVMMLDGLAAPLRDATRKDVTAHFQKVDGPIFRDEWDDQIEDPELRMSAGGPSALYHKTPEMVPESIPVKPPAPVVRAEKKPAPVKAQPKPVPAPVVSAPAIPKPLNPQEMLTSRSRRLVAEIPLKGDSISLSFYDNAEIDGDSISLFMNGKLLYEHVLLKASAFVVTISVSELADSNEMVMVAENQGSIPPNTSLMVTYVEGKRYEATLESTEGSSAMIRFVKPRG